jgi:hypothetical protein
MENLLLWNAYERNSMGLTALNLPTSRRLFNGVSPVALAKNHLQMNTLKARASLARNTGRPQSRFHAANFNKDCFCCKHAFACGRCPKLLQDSLWFARAVVFFATSCRTIKLGNHWRRQRQGPNRAAKIADIYFYPTIFVGFIARI